MLQIAHRGGMDERPENMLASFQAALADGFDAIELDVRVCKSGEAVVFHDDTLLRLAGDGRRIADVELNELAKISIADQTIPTLESVLTGLPPTHIFIDLKDEASVAATAELIKISAQHKLVVISKNKKWLGQMRHHSADVALGFVSNKHFLPPVKFMQTIGAEHFICHQRLVNWFGVKTARRHQIKTVAYPIKSKLMAKILASHGIEGLEWNHKPTR